MANIEKTAKRLSDLRYAGSQRGVIGRQTDTGVILRESPLNAIEVYVTLNDDPRNAIVAVCKFNQVIGAHVWVQKGRGSKYEVVDIDYTASHEVFGDATVDLFSPPQTGALDQSLRSTKNTIEGRGRAATGANEPGGLFVRIEAFNHAGGRWEGDFVDLTANLPATADTKALIVVCINEGTNLPVVYTGAEYGLAATILESSLYADVTFADDDIPLWWWELTDDQTSILPSTRNGEFRWWLTRGGAGGGSTETLELTGDSGSAANVLDALLQFEGGVGLISVVSTVVAGSVYKVSYRLNIAELDNATPEASDTFAFHDGSVGIARKVRLDDLATALGSSVNEDYYSLFITGWPG